MACVCSQYNARSDWLIGLALFSRNNHRPITGLQKQRKKPYNNNLLTSNFRSLRENLKPRPRRIGLGRFRFEIFLQTRHSLLKRGYC